MSLEPGVRLGPYEIQSAIGAGGMGEVYKARDTRLDRTVAIKILPDALAADAELRDRFDREARAISQLNHPHVCALYDVGEHAGTAFLVMEHLEGETLAARLERGRLPSADALRVGIAVAHALDAAHRAGIVHRDLKPANVMLTKSGPKLLDFGLAKSRPEVLGDSAGSMLPTTPHNVTARGTILGTFQYMAPEQLEGGDADARTDIFAFGAVLYEMLTGRKAFAGRSHASLISAIMTAAPAPVGGAAGEVPAAIDRLIARCLAKDPAARWHCAADLAIQLQWADDDRARPIVLPADVAIGSPSRRRAWVAATILLVILSSVLGVLAWPHPAAAVAVVEFPVAAPPKQTLGAPSGLMSLSPDGRHLAFFTGGVGPDSSLWIRSFDSPTARMIPGTEDGWHPFWSPDGRWVGFVVGSMLKKVDVAGGPARVIGDSNRERGAWSTRDVIVMGGPDGRLYQVSANGGPQRAVTELDKARGETAHSWPVFLPDGRRFIFLARASMPENRALYLASLDEPGRTRILDAFSSVEISAGRLLYQRDGTLFAQTFDDKAGRVVGEPVPIVENIEYNPGNGRTAVTASANGTLAFRTLTAAGSGRLTWFDAAGKVLETVGKAETFSSARISPDGSRIVLAQPDEQRNEDLWMISGPGHIYERFTFDPSPERTPIWSPDGRWIVFSSQRGGHEGLYRRLSDGSGVDELLFESDHPMAASDISPDGKIVLATYIVTGAKTRLDVFAVPIDGSRTAYPVVQSSSDDSNAVFSPDGRWIAYDSEGSGAPQVFVQPFPPSGGKWQLSKGGAHPRWSRDGRSLLYCSLEWHLMAVDVTTAGGRFERGNTRDLFAAPIAHLEPFFDVAADGRFLLVSQTGDAIDTPMIVRMNWPAAIRK